jgi:hypothetical protein
MLNTVHFDVPVDEAPSEEPVVDDGGAPSPGSAR